MKFKYRFTNIKTDEVKETIAGSLEGAVIKLEISLAEWRVETELTAMMPESEP